MRWRVHYHLHAAGGRRWPTSCEVDAPTKADALKEVERRQRRIDSQAARAHRGDYANAVVVSIEPEVPWA